MPVPVRADNATLSCALAAESQYPEIIGIVYYTIGKVAGLAGVVAVIVRAVLWARGGGSHAQVQTSRTARQDLFETYCGGATCPPHEKRLRRAGRE